MTDPRTEHLRRLDAALAGPARLRRSLLREAADHLEDATDAYVRAGLAPGAAAARAVADFGSVEEVAPAYRTTLAVGGSRRTAALLLAVLGAQPFLWDSGLELAAANHGGRDDNWLVHLLDGAIEVGGLLVLAGALLALVVTGIGNRWWSLGRTWARLTSHLALASAAYVVTTCFTMTLAAGGAPPRFWALVLTLMVLPMAAVARSARQTLATTRAVDPSAASAWPVRAR